MPTRADGRNRRKRIVSGIRRALWASMRAWSKAILARPPRIPVSMILNEGGDVMQEVSSLWQSPLQLASYLADVVSVEFEGVGSDVPRRRIPIRAITGGDIG